MSLLSSSAKVTGSTGFYDFPIEQSLRFDGSSYGTRTESRAGSSTKMTMSFWVKISKIDKTSFLVAHSNTAGSDTHSFLAKLEPSNQIDISCAGVHQKSFAILRDTSAWYHIVVSLDSTITATERLKIFLNGDRLTMDTSFSGGGYPSDTSNLSLAGYRFFFSDPYNQGRHLNGYLANLQYIDGQALDASYFGETKQDIWIPKEYTGSYGTNGFHLDFADASNIGNDVSGNNNDWTVN